MFSFLWSMIVRTTLPELKFGQRYLKNTSRLSLAHNLKQFTQNKMNSFLFTLCMLCAAVLRSSSALATTSDISPPIVVNPPTVKELDVTAYSGKWFVAYASLTLQKSILKDGFCIVQENTLKEGPGIPGLSKILPIRFDITITENIGGATGTAKQLNGVATNWSFGKNPGQFVLRMNGLPATHWVLAVGPVESGGVGGSNGQYSWAIVSDALGSTLAVLARDMTSFQQYEQSVLDRVKTLGFTTLATKPNKIYQSETCNYPAGF